MLKNITVNENII